MFLKFQIFLEDYKYFLCPKKLVRHTPRPCPPGAERTCNMGGKLGTWAGREVHSDGGVEGRADWSHVAARARRGQL